MLLTGNTYVTKGAIVLMFPFCNTSVTPVMLKILVTFFTFKTKGRLVKLGLHGKLLILDFDFKKINKQKFSFMPQIFMFQKCFYLNNVVKHK